MAMIYSVTLVRSMIEPGNSLKPNLSLPQHEGYFITCAILEARQYYHGHVVNVNAKTE